MPLIHERVFRVRHYECDAYGHVNQANYVRYCQEAAFDASAAAGYDMATYEAMDRMWLVRETEVKYLRPLRYGDSVLVRTWVDDFRRVRSRRAYELRHAGSGKLVARATTDWVFLQLSTLRPAAIPPEMEGAFFPEGAPDAAPPRKRFPPAQPTPNAFCQQRRAEWRDLDPAGHVNNSTYLAYVEDCGVQALTTRGWPIARMEAEGLAIVARRQRIEYQQPALLDDELEVTTWLSEADRATALRQTTITRPADGALIARARTHHVWVDLGTGRPAAIPDTVLEALGLPGQHQ